MFTGIDPETIVFYLFSTSNHNGWLSSAGSGALSFISFLHQTTTGRECYLFLFYCLLSLFYIKPQPMICIFFCFSRLQQTKCIRSGDDLSLLFQYNLAKNIDIKILSFHQSFELGVQERNGGTVVFTHFEYTVLCL